MITLLLLTDTMLRARHIKMLGSRDIDIVLQVIRIGDLIIFASPREMYVEFQLMLKEKSPSDKNNLYWTC